jgi:hypothetical protein
MENEKKSRARIFNPAPWVFKISCKGDPGEEPNPVTVTRMLLPQHRLGLDLDRSELLDPEQRLERAEQLGERDDNRQDQDTEEAATD